MTEETAVGIASIGIVFVAVIFAVVMSILLTVIPFWQICKKAGFHPALSLLMLVPFGQLILPFYIAFANWPALRGNISV